MWAGQLLTPCPSAVTQGSFFSSQGFCRPLRVRRPRHPTLPPGLRGSRGRRRVSPSTEAQRQGWSYPCRPRHPAGGPHGPAKPFPPATTFPWPGHTHTCRARAADRWAQQGTPPPRLLRRGCPPAQLPRLAASPASSPPSGPGTLVRAVAAL